MYYIYFLHIIHLQSDLLHIKKLGISFLAAGKKNDVIHNLQFSIKENEWVSIVGESGSGKSLTALSIVGLLPSQAIINENSLCIFRNKKNEEIKLHSCTNLQWQKIRGYEIGVIFQEPMTSLNPLMRCGAQIAEVLKAHNNYSISKAKEEVLKLLTEVEIPNPTVAYSKYPHQMSGGQKQRVMIAMAIACKPKLLIADEPTTALDVTVQKKIMLLLKSLQLKHNMSVLFISHDLNVVSAFSDRIYVMYNGTFIEEGSTNQIMHYAQNAYTKSLIMCKPPINKRLKILPTVNDILENKIDFFSTENNISNKEYENHLHILNKAPYLLSLNDVHISYPLEKNFIGKTTAWQHVVQGVSLLIRNGETIGLAGESGCGKTSIGKAIVGLTPIQQGNIVYVDKNIKSMNKVERLNYQKAVQIIFQDPYGSLNPRMNVGDILEEPLKYYNLVLPNERKDYVLHLLKITGLNSDSIYKYPHEFSGGQRQRISIARALAMKPKLLICDESVSALDVSVQAQILNLLNDLKKEFDLSFLFISHDLQILKHFCDNIAIMYKGKILEMQDAENLYKHPENNYTSNFINAGFYK